MNIRENRRTRKKIIICDDNSVFLDIFKFIFKRDELEILALPDGKDLYATAKLHLPSLILLDIMMPGKDGIAALEELSADPGTSTIPVVVVSSVVSPEIMHKAKKLGAKEFVEKPFNAVVLREVVRRYIRQGKTEKERGLI